MVILIYNNINRYMFLIIRIRVILNKLFWFSEVKVGDIYLVVILYGEGRFVVLESLIKELIVNG